LGVEMLLSALDVTEGSGNLYLTNVAVMGCSCDKGAGTGATAAGTGATAAGTGATAAGTGATAAGTGATAGDKFLKIIRLFKILINPRSNVINPFNTSLVDEMYDSTKS